METTEENNKNKKERKISLSYLLKSFGENINKLEEASLVDEKGIKDLRAIHEKAVKGWIGLTFKM